MLIRDIKEEMKGMIYRHNHPCLKALDRYIRKNMRKRASKQGIILINKDIMNRILKGCES